ncbi:unnamed protein product [Trichobilharzia regenti]|nr:unnamed protein product [Trichobilharzia regenti]
MLDGNSNTDRVPRSYRILHYKLCSDDHNGIPKTEIYANTLSIEEHLTILNGAKKQTNNSDDLNDEVGEESDTDLPVALSFTQQAKQRELHQKQINKAIIEARLKRKAIRKAKHNKQGQTVHHPKDKEVDDEVQFSPPNEQQKLKEKDPLEEEFNFPGHFKASDHLHCEEADDDDGDDEDQSSVHNERSFSDIAEDKSVYGNEKYNPSAKQRCVLHPKKYYLTAKGTWSSFETVTDRKTNSFKSFQLAGFQGF